MICFHCEHRAASSHVWCAGWLRVHIARTARSRHCRTLRPDSQVPHQPLPATSDNPNASFKRQQDVPGNSAFKLHTLLLLVRTVRAEPSAVDVHASILGSKVKAQRPDRNTHPLAEQPVLTRTCPTPDPFGTQRWHACG